MNRKNLLLPLILFSFSNLHAVNFTLADSIINSAVDATEGLQSAMENAVNTGEEMMNMATGNFLDIEENSKMLEQLPDAETLPMHEVTTSTYQNESDLEDENEDEDEDIMTGSIEEGHKIFLTHIKPVCGVTGAEFAANYSQEEWEEIFEAGEFKEVLIQHCPKIAPNYNDEWEADLVRFSHEYANDSDSISDC